ncbi:MAG: hypothetical protein ABGF52_13355 [Candidatus Asgardarchaeum sp.]
MKNKKKIGLERDQKTIKLLAGMKENFQRVIGKFFACRKKMPPAPAGGVSLVKLWGKKI